MAIFVLAVLVWLIGKEPAFHSSEKMTGMKIIAATMKQMQLINPIKASLWFWSSNPNHPFLREPGKTLLPIGSTQIPFDSG